MTQATHTSHPHCGLLPALLCYLYNSGNQSNQLIEMAYGWCSFICENDPIQTNIRDTVLLPLEIGLQHIDQREKWMVAKLIHTEHHQKLASIVFSSRDGEAIADLHAWTSGSTSYRSYPQLEICAEHLIDLHYLHPFSSRL